MWWCVWASSNAAVRIRKIKPLTEPIMLPSVLLLIFGKLQDYVGRNGPVWPWALSYGLCLGVAGFVVVGGEMSPIAAAAFGFYCWAYLVLLRQWRGERARWLGVYWFGALLPLVIVLVSFSVMQRSLV